MSCRDTAPRGVPHLSRRVAAAAVSITVMIVSTLGVRAGLPEWIRNVDANGRLHDAVFRTVTMPSGPVEVRRSPAEAYEALLKFAGTNDAEVLALRARVAEEKLDPAAAEADWKANASASSDTGAGQLALADFYHRRLLPRQEADALARAAQAADPPADRLSSGPERRSWRTFERLFALVASQQLPDSFAEAQYRAWIARFPEQRQPYDRLFRFLVDRNRGADAEALLAAYQKTFPSDEAWVLTGRAELAIRGGAIADALAVYDQAFRPSWDAEILRGYFDLLERTHTMRAFLDRARADVRARPADLAPVARVFYYYHRAGNIAAAEQALAEFETRRERAPRTAEELFTLAHFYELTRNQNEALRYYASVYSLPGAAPADVERALATIIETLFSAPEQPLRFGAGDLSFYRDVATLDRYPGFFNGVLSLLFNSASPRSAFAREEQTAVSYFHRARAADLLALFETRFPTSTRRPALNAQLISSYAVYGESDAVIQRGSQFLATFADAPQRTDVALAMADAYARKDQIAEELATYDRLLQELGARADRVPIGAAPTREATDAPAQSTGARSQVYARVLDRYIARLVSRKQFREAFAVYRREIERNPADPGLYAAAAQFLEQNNFTADVEQVYRHAMQQFPDHSWHHRLARWYLRQRQAAAFESLTRDVTRAFDGTELGRYFSAVVARGPGVNAQLFLQLNLFAQERFPHNLLFVRNLLSAYASRETGNPAAYETLLRHHWSEDDQLAAEFFARLSRSNRLDAEITGVRGATPGSDWSRAARENPLAVRFLAEADIWRSRFESATPVLTALAVEFPGDIEVGQRVTSLHRSLSYADAREADAAAQAAGRLQQFEPRNVSTLTTLGEIFADRDRFDQARPFWDRIPAVEPGNAGRYLEAATVFWDYYQFDNALRILAEGRKTLGNRALYAYEAGAIYEGLRRPEQAVAEYVRGALAESEGSPARNRLLTLAKRQAYRDLVDRASASAVEGDTPPSVAVSLRIALLETQERRDDLERLLLAVLERTPSPELMIEIGAQAERLGFEAARTRALTRQIEVMRDPIDKLQLRLALVRLYESRNELDLARKTSEALYAENPRVLGIVRQTADYYWRHDLRGQAIDVLTAAAASSYPALRKQFIFEAARKSNEIGEYARTRELLKPLLAEDPFNADYLAAVADSHALAKDDRSLRDFYAATIEAMRTAPLPADERTRRVAGLRRALIPALTRLNDHAGAVDQYVEIINRFPDDEELLAEAGRYARQHDRRDQLLGYYTKTASDSPRDYRWPMLLAKLETQFEDFPAAIASYAKTIAIRPDRVDFQTARARLEERLMRFDAAVESYTRTYELTYHDPQWMVKIAEVRARQGQVDAAVKALRAALIEGRPERAENAFAVAEQLATWKIVEPAKPFVDEGARLAGARGLLERGAPYVRIYTRLRQWNAAFDALLAARLELQRAAAPSGGPSATDLFAARFSDMADVVSQELTPEEKSAFAAFLDQRKETLPAGDLESVLVPVAERAGLVEQAVRWRIELMEAERQADANRHMPRVIELQSERLRFADLAQELERFADRGGPHTVEARFAAADAYRKAGDQASELRILSRIAPPNLLGGPLMRYFELLLARDPQRLIALTGTGSPGIRDSAATYIVGHGTADQALAAVRARGQGLAPVWLSAYTALVGLHFGRFDAVTSQAFTTALGDGTIGDRLKPIDRRVRLAGDLWFEYASRFGEYLTFAKQARGEDYLPAQIERTPARSDAYVSLGDFYRDQGTDASALAVYDRAATLNTRRSDVHVRAAAILWRQGRRAAAIERWKQAMQLLAAQAGRGSIDTPPLVAVLEAIGSRRIFGELREPADRMVRAYIARNGTYRADSLFRAAYRAAGDATTGTEWLLDLSRAAPDQSETLGAIARATWLPDAQRDRFYERIVTVREANVTRLFGEAQAAAQGELDRSRLERIRSLIDTKQAVRASELLRALPENVRRQHEHEVTTIETRIAAAEGTLAALLDRYQREDTHRVNLDALRNAATFLRRAGDTASSRRVMEFVYTRELERENLVPPTFLGLAEIRLQQGNVPAALDLLHRLTLVVGEPFDNLTPSAALLERLNHPSDALEFRRARVQAVPWDARAQIAFARTEIAAGQDRAAALVRLTRVVESPREQYSVRVDAARAFARAGGQLDRPARTELDYLRTPVGMTPATVDRPFFVASRVAAAQRITDVSARVALLRSAVAIDPADTSLRVPLFRAEIAAGRPADAIEALQPILQRSRGLTNVGLTTADRARLALELGEAHQQLDRLSEAVRFFTIALEGQTAAARTPIRQRIAALNEEIGRRARNAARQPIVREAVDQPQLVRPRIPPRSAAAPAALAARGAALAAFDGRGIPACGVAPPSNTPGILGRRALPAGRAPLRVGLHAQGTPGRLARLGATPALHHGLRGAGR